MTSAITERLQGVIAFITLTLLNPGWNPRAAWALYALLGTLVLLIFVIGAEISMAFSQRKRRTKTTPAVVATAEVLENADDAPSASTAAQGPRPRPKMGRTFWTLAAACGALVVVIAWITAGFTTSTDAVCKSCHWPASSHAQAAAGVDPHARTSCVACHESGNVANRLVTGVPLRLLHFASASGEASLVVGYGRVSEQACADCHDTALRVTVADATRGLKISHKEPMSAGATCTDCHMMSNGIVATHNAGMQPCMRCHDDKKASAACITCHEKNVAAAARARTAAFQNPQIPQVRCGGCHNQKRDCDPCHGTRMPHTQDFMLHNHARAAVVDFWYNGGKGCAKCHTETRRPCRCHSKDIGHAHGSTAVLAQTHQSATTERCNTCHQRYAYLATRDFCKDVCHTAQAEAASPR